MRTRLLVASAVIVILFAGCKGSATKMSEDAAAPDASATQGTPTMVIGPEGGQLVTGDVTLTIPPGALVRPMQLTVSVHGLRGSLSGA